MTRLSLRLAMPRSPQRWKLVHALVGRVNRKPLLLPFGLLLLLLITWIDYATGAEVSFSIFYLVPTSLVAWKLGRRAGIAFALLSSIAWLFADKLSGQVYSHPAIPVWNASVRLGFFLTTVLVLAGLRDALEREKTWARLDPLTGLANGRSFRELLLDEAIRSRRYAHPLSLAYIDLDDFKTVNDQLGHAAGDDLLRDVGALLRTTSRTSDTPARLAGDEFALLMPETGPDVSRIAVERIRDRLNELMRTRGWKVTSSIGLVTYVVPPESVDTMLKAADALMYSAKQQGKNAVSARVEHPRSEGTEQR